MARFIGRAPISVKGYSMLSCLFYPNPKTIRPTALAFKEMDSK